MTCMLGCNVCGLLVVVTTDTPNNPAKVVTRYGIKEGGSGEGSGGEQGEWG